MIENLKELLSYDPQQPMIFISGIFLWLFALFLAIYVSLRNRQTLRTLFVIFFSYYFYYKSSGSYFFLLAIVTLCDYFLAHGISRLEKRWQRKTLVCLSLCVNLGLLAYFKYANFLGEIFASLSGG